MAADHLARVLIGVGRRRRKAPSWLLTIKDVADACQLPQPAVAQLVPRTWTDKGWMYTAEQLNSAVEIGVRDGSYWTDHGDAARDGRRAR